MIPAHAPRPFSVRVFLPSGDPDGIKVIEKPNWTGAGLVVPRALFSGGKTRPEFGRTGVYLLVGPDESTSLPRLYVGEGDSQAAKMSPLVTQMASGKRASAAHQIRSMTSAAC